MENLESKKGLLKNIEISQKEDIKIKNEVGNLTNLLENKRKKINVLIEEIEKYKTNTKKLIKKRNRILKNQSIFFLLLELFILLFVNLTNIFQLSISRYLISILTLLNLFIQGIFGTKELLKKAYIPKKVNENKITEIFLEIKREETEILNLEIQLKNEAEKLKKIETLEKEKKTLDQKQEYLNLLYRLENLILILVEKKTKKTNLDFENKNLKEEHVIIRKLEKKT